MRTGVFLVRTIRHFLDSIRDWDNIRFIHTSLPMDVAVKQRGDTIDLTCSDLTGKRSEISADMVVLCPAMVPSKGIRKIVRAAFDYHGIRTAFLPKDIQNLLRYRQISKGYISPVVLRGRRIFRTRLPRGLQQRGRYFQSLCPEGNWSWM